MESEVIPLLGAVGLINPGRRPAQSGHSAGQPGFAEQALEGPSVTAAQHQRRCLLHAPAWRHDVDPGAAILAARSGKAAL